MNQAAKILASSALLALITTGCTQLPATKPGAGERLFKGETEIVIGPDTNVACFESFDARRPTRCAASHIVAFEQNRRR